MNDRFLNSFLNFQQPILLNKPTGWQVEYTQENLPSFRNNEPLSPEHTLRKKIGIFQGLQQTPGFSTEFAQIVGYQDSSQRYLPVNLGSVTKSELAAGAAFQQSANIMQDINRNFKRNFKHLQLRRLKNRLEEVKTIQNDLTLSLRQQAEFTQSSMQRIAAEVGKWTKRTIEVSVSQINIQVAEKDRIISLLQGKVKQGEGENGKLKKQLQLQKTRHFGNQKTLLGKKQSFQSRSSLAQPCANCKILQIKHSALRDELIRSEKQMDVLVSDNQSLQQRVFDLEQQITGIDLQVEKRLSEHVKIFQLRLAQVTAQPQQRQQNEDYLEIVRRLNDQNGLLQERYENLQRISMKQHQLKQWQQKLFAQEEDYKRKEMALFESQANHERQKERLYQREHQIMITEQELIQQQSQLRKKEEEIKSKEKIRRSKQNTPLPSVENRIGGGENVLIHDFSSFGKIQQKFEGANHQWYSTQQNNYKNQRFHSQQDFFIPPLPIGEPAHNRVKTQYMNQQEQTSTPRGNWRNYGPSQVARRYEGMYRKERDVSPQEKLQHTGKYQMPIPSSPQNYRQSSKISRASGTKSIRTTYQPVAVQQRRQMGQVMGLSSKLDKLRLQIKRQMQAIR